MKHQKSPTSKRSQPKQQLTCPTCRRPFAIPLDAEPGRHRSYPFCSERCKLLDLGAWLDAKYRIPARPDEESEDALPGDFGDAEAAL